MNIVNKVFLFFLFLLFFKTNTSLAQVSFKQQQLKYNRVRNAYAEKHVYLKQLLVSKGVDTASMNMFIRAFKEDDILEVWVTDKSKAGKYTKLAAYNICAKSGKPGPKRRQGDYQVPEGYYHIAVFNPWSSYHLSLGINYPNSSDRILGYKPNLGGDIMIHGSCVTIGCIPLTDKIIEEVYVLAVEAKAAGQKHIPVHIYPAKPSGEKFKRIMTDNVGNEELVSFWQDLKKGYELFEEEHALPKVSVSKTGRYLFN